MNKRGRVYTDVRHEAGIKRKQYINELQMEIRTSNTGKVRSS